MLHLETYVSFTDYVMECLNNVMHNNKILNQITSLLFTGTGKLYLNQQGHLYFHKYIPVQDLSPNSSSFTDADIIFNILLTSPINYISVECQC